MIGSVFSRYKILDELDVGGIRAVYKAEETHLKHSVALRFHPQTLIPDPEAKKRFTHEAQAASPLDDPNMCNLYEIIESDDGQIFMACACNDGETLCTKEAAQVENGGIS